METQRQYPRYASDATVEVHWQEQVVEGRCRNVSKGGMCAETRGAITPGTTVQLKLTLVFDEDTFSEPLELPARAVWCTPIGTIHQVGFQFLAVAPEKSSYLSMFLRFLDNGQSSDSGEESDPDLFG